MPLMQDINLLLALPLVQQVRQLAEQKAGQAYLVGGAVRDWLLEGEIPKDLDFVLLDCKAAALAKSLADSATNHFSPESTSKTALA